MAGIFSIQTDVYTGPLDLLIELVEKHKLLINDISLAAVTDDYMRQVSEMQERSLPHTAQFVQLAATLLLIKSKSLLPILELTQEEEATIEDLEARLREYQVYRDAAKNLEEIFGRVRLAAPQETPPAITVFLPDTWTTLSSLQAALTDLLNELPQTADVPRVQVTPIISLEAMIDRLHERIERQLTLRFSELIADAPERKTAIVGFLAILESVKQGRVLVQQISHFEDITLEHAQVGTPTYRF